MALRVEQLRIVHYPSAVLRTPAKPIDQVTEEVRAVAHRMLTLMHEARGVGLAAPQVGLSWRLFVVNATGEPGDDRIFINPVLADPSPETHVREEGCLSIPGVHADITRPIAITIHALDERGERFSLTSNDLDARVWQHEMDHLDGVLILDRMPPMERLANRRAIRELEDARGA